MRKSILLSALVLLFINQTAAAEDNVTMEDLMKEIMSLKARVAELEDKLSRVEIMDDNDAPSDKVLLGTTVTLDSDGLEMTYTMVSALEADPDAGKISVDSPIGSAALGHSEGDVITVQLPKGPMEFTIRRITR